MLYIHLFPPGLMEGGMYDKMVVEANTKKKYIFFSIYI